MGKTTRWLKALFGMKSSTRISASGISPTEVACLRSYYPPQFKLNSNVEKKKNGVAEVSWAALRIQTNFRGYLARKARRALKGVVKIQALVRGYLVRKQANATLRAMQALFRLQSNRATYGLVKGPAQSDTRHWARPSMGGFRDGFETEQYYKAPRFSGRSRRLSASSFEARTLKLSIEEDKIKVAEVDNRQVGSRLGRKRPNPNNSFSELGEDTSSYQMLHHECLVKSGQLCYYNHPNYMAKTMSFRAKTRHQSAPKERPEPIDCKRNSVSSGRIRMSLSEVMMEGRNSVNERVMQGHVPMYMNSSTLKVL